MQYEQVCVELPTSADNVTLPAFAGKRRAAAPLLLGARRPPLSIDICCPHGAQQQTRRTPRLRSNNGTDGRTLDRFIDLAPHTTRVEQCQYTGLQLKSAECILLLIGFVVTLDVRSCSTGNRLDSRVDLLRFQRQTCTTNLYLV